MIPTNVRNKQLAKKRAARKKKAKDAALFIRINSAQQLSKRQKEYLEDCAAQKVRELMWRQQRMILGLPWACRFDGEGNIYPVKRST